MLTRSKAKGRRLTGVSATLRCDHRSRAGVVHAHTWEIKVWCCYDGRDGETLRFALDEVLAQHQGKCLPDAIAWGEPLAEWIAQQINIQLRECAAVEINRADERLHARWEA